MRGNSWVSLLVIDTWYISHNKRKISANEYGSQCEVQRVVLSSELPRRNRKYQRDLASVVSVIGTKVTMMIIVVITIKIMTMIPMAMMKITMMMIMTIIMIMMITIMTMIAVVV